MTLPPYFLTIAASDTSGGAGIQQDLKMAQLLGFWGLSVITAITAQDFSSVYQLESVSEEMFVAQLKAVTNSFDISAVKIGVVPSLRFAELLVDYLKHLSCPIVYDPVIASTSGYIFTPQDTYTMIKTICSIATVITPNIPELKLFIGDDWKDNILSLADTFGCAVYVKGGHCESDQIDEFLVQIDKPVQNFSFDKHEWKYTHGTGCTFSSLLSMFLAIYDLPQACLKAREKLVEVYM